MSCASLRVMLKRDFDKLPAAVGKLVLVHTCEECKTEYVLHPLPGSNEPPFTRFLKCASGRKLCGPCCIAAGADDSLRTAHEN